MSQNRIEGRDVIPLAEVVENGTEPEIARSIFPGLGCGFFTVTLILPSIRRVCSVMLAPAFCAHNARLLMSHWERSSMDIENNLVFLLTVVTDSFMRDVFGMPYAKMRQFKD